MTAFQHPCDMVLCSCCFAFPVTPFLLALKKKGHGRMEPKPLSHFVGWPKKRRASKLLVCQYHGVQPPNHICPSDIRFGCPPESSLKASRNQGKFSPFLGDPTACAVGIFDSSPQPELAESASPSVKSFQTSHMKQIKGNSDPRISLPWLGQQSVYQVVQTKQLEV